MYGIQRGHLLSIELIPIARHAATHTHYSSNVQDEMSIEDQQQQCRQFTEKHGITITQEHTDFGISGTAIGNRPGESASAATGAPRSRRRSPRWLGGMRCLTM